MTATGPGEPARPTEPSGPSPHAGRFRWTWVMTWSLLSAIGAVVLTWLWFTDTRVEILAATGALVAIAVAIVLHHLVVTQDRGEQQAARSTAVEELPASDPARRRIVASIGGAAITVLAGLVGLQRYGPVPMRGTAWSSGSHLVTITGTRLRPADIPLGGVVTVWPESAVGTELAAVMLIRLREEPLPPTRLGGVVDDALVAYSRLCTHAGCAVALYRDRDQALFCPCHQATFDARRGATPTQGPASVPLPQLPLGIDDDGALIATGDLTRRPGPVGGTVRE